MQWRNTNLARLLLTALFGCTFCDTSGNTGGGCGGPFAANGALQRVTFQSCRDTPVGKQCENLGPKPLVAVDATFNLKASRDGAQLSVKTVSPEWFPPVFSSFRAASTRSAAFLAVDKLDTFVDDVFVDYLNVQGVIPDAIALFRASTNPGEFIVSATKISSERELTVEEYAAGNLYVGFLHQEAQIIGIPGCQFTVADPNIAILEATNGDSPRFSRGKVIGTTRVEITCGNLKTSALVVNRSGQFLPPDAGTDAAEHAGIVDAADAGAP
jgi:hypothetical protein